MKNKNILIIGISGSGKTYIVQKLKNKYPSIYDSDEIQGLSDWFGWDRKPVKFSKNANKKWLEEHEFLWNREVLQKFIEKNEPVIIFGLSGNCFNMLDLFNEVYYLDISPAEIKKRLKSQNRLNPMGKTKEQADLVIKYMKTIRRKASALKILFIDANQSPKQIINQIMR
jgi:shikimate kinase